MKTASFIFCAAALVLASTSCGKHSWKETQVLHEGMHKAHDEGHGDSHAAHGDKTDHSEKKAH